MDKFRVMLYLLNDYTNYGIAYPKKAKEIAAGANIALTETYKTLRDLREKGLIWRVGQKYKYRFGLKEGPQLNNLVQLYDCLTIGQSLPLNLRIESQVLVELQEKNKLNNNIKLRTSEEQKILQIKLSRVRFLSQEGRKKAVTECISRIIEFYSTMDETSSEEEIMSFLRKEFGFFLSTLYGAEIIGED